jgi:hypothetical protein
LKSRITRFPASTYYLLRHLYFRTLANFLWQNGKQPIPQMGGLTVM